MTAPSSNQQQDPLRYATGYHAPVLWREVVRGLVTDAAGTYVDATLGGGGHARALLDRLEEGGRVVGIDQDAEALAEAGERLKDEVEAGRLVLVQGNFGDLDSLLKARGIDEVDGLLLDLGVSSHQIDAGRRGFSYRQEGPLDMRMGEGGLLAHDLVNTWDERDLRHLLHTLGEERRARRIAQQLVQARPLETTTELAHAVRSAVPERDEVKTLSRVFQALRIAVNRELEVLEQALEAVPQVVRVGGRVAVISYHSLEDRRVKRFLRHGNFEGDPKRDFYGQPIAPLREIERKPIDAQPDEVEANPRARSARLRIAEVLPPSDAAPLP